MVVEDDVRLQAVLKRLLESDSHVVDLVGRGDDALEMALARDPGIDAIVLDIGLPDMSGVDVARRLRAARSPVPILVLTARDAVDQRIAGLDAGADDYMVKPFSYGELVARLRAIVRRAAPVADRAGAILRCGPIELHEGHRRVTVAGRPIDLTLREFALLECLIRHPDQVLSRDQLLDHAWPFGSAVTLNSVDAYMSFLRRKLGPAGAARIQTVRGIGYRLAPSEAA
jgi:two-component system OmpR family response regulator